MPSRRSRSNSHLSLADASASARRGGPPDSKSGGRAPTSPTETELRIIGGAWRGRKIVYSGDLRTRPMKDRVRENLFNLVGPQIKQSLVFDLFAGTGALAFEALSRGAARAILVERHYPTAQTIRDNARHLACEDRITIHTADTFHWSREFASREPAVPSDSPAVSPSTADAANTDADRPWAVFISPPYALYSEQQEAMLELITQFMEKAPTNSLLAVESDTSFDTDLLPDAERWKVRTYAPAQVAILRKRDDAPADEA